MDFRRAKEAYSELLVHKKGSTDFQREADLMELNFEEDPSRVGWSVIMNDLFGFLDLDPTEEGLEEILRDCIAQHTNFEDFLDEALIPERMAA